MCCVQGYGPSHDRRHTKQSDDWDLPDSGVTDLREVRDLLIEKILSEIYATSLCMCTCEGYYLTYFIIMQSDYWSWDKLERAVLSIFICFMYGSLTGMGSQHFSFTGGLIAGCRIMWVESRWTMKSRTRC